MSCTWYRSPHGIRAGRPPADGGEYELVDQLGPAHMQKGAALQFADRTGRLESGTIVAWGERGVTVEVKRPTSFVEKAWATAPVVRYRVAYHRIRSVTSAHAALMKSRAGDVPKVKHPDLQPGDEVLLRGDHVACVQHVGADAVHVVRDDGIYHRTRPRDVAKVLRRAPRPRADQVAAPPTTQESADGEAGTSLTPVMFQINDLVAWRSGSLHGTALVVEVRSTGLDVLTLPGGSLVPHQVIALTIEELRPLSSALLATAGAGDALRLLVRDGLETALVEWVVHDGAYVKSPDGDLAFIPAAFVIALHRTAPPRRPGTVTEPQKAEVAA